MITVKLTIVFPVPPITGAFPPPKGQKEAVSRAMTLAPVQLCFIQFLAFASGYLWYSVLQYFYCCLF